MNSVLTATYWEIGRRIVEHEQHGQARAEYGESLLGRLAQDLSARHGRGFSERNLLKMRELYLNLEISPTLSAESRARVCLVDVQSAKSEIPPPSSANSEAAARSLPLGAFPLSWSHYVRLMSVDNPQARAFYEAEAIRGGWSVRQIERWVLEDDLLGGRAGPKR
ncbi:MAG: DUF1016 N-terminal domain-containing protein, partial [Planctomycetota bacterium]